MICPKCGRTVPDGAPCPCGAPVLSSNPAVNLMKTLGSSPKFLTAAILYSVTVLFNLLASFGASDVISTLYYYGANYGFDPEEQPVYNTVEGVLESTSMLSVRGGRGRWHSNAAKPRTSFIDGGHLFEGWNGSETCRLTMLIGKQAPDIACIQVYSPKGLYRPVRHFGWVKLGSDDRNEGVDFGRRWAVRTVLFGRAGRRPDRHVV